MRIVVIGGTGNISTSIVRRLLELGHDVTCYNRARRGGPPRGARAMQGDRKDRQAFEEAMQRERFDAAIDMICFNREDAESSVRAFRGVGHFVQCSTVCTYGVDYDWLPASEDHPLRPITDYGRTKVAADAVPDADTVTWEEEIIAAQRGVRRGRPQASGSSRAAEQPEPLPAL